MSKVEQKDKKCYRCKETLVTRIVNIDFSYNETKLIHSTGNPYNRKVVCSKCNNFIKWDKPEMDEVMKDKINDFFNNTDLSGRSDKFYTSLYYKWAKDGVEGLSQKQLEIVYKHPKF